MAIGQDPRGITNNELILGKLVYKHLKRQSKYLEDNREKIYNNPKGIQHDLKVLDESEENRTLILKGQGYSEDDEETFESFRVAMGLYVMIENMKPQIEKVATIGYVANYRRHKTELEGLDIALNRQLPKDYGNLFGDLQLSNYQGSITRTTKRDVLQAIENGIKNNSTVNELARDISKLNNTLFSANRSKMIAQSELGKSYEYGNYLPMKQAEREGADVIKRRNTVGDNRVRPSHVSAEGEGWIPFDDIFESVGQGFPPEGVRCRCTIDYKLK